MFLRLIGLLAIGFTVSSCDEGWMTGGCEFTETDRLVALDNGLVAQVIEVGCGATTGHTEWLVVGEPNNLRPYKDTRVAAVEGEFKAMEYQAGELLVTFQADKVFGQVSQIGDLRIRFAKAD